ncbi:MAG: ABC transporter ATP-binding protein [Actinomycetales bacterium]|nr:ABC transporter ATP-binding protein [Actinomycetales bacterium]
MSRLRMRDVTRLFAGGAGVREIDLVVEPGQIHALVGLNGAGKTTIMRLALGMLRPDAGEVAIDDEPLGRRAPALWARVGHLVETPLAYGELTGLGNLEIGARLHGAGRRGSAIARAALAEFGLEAYRDVPVRRLSLGNRQRVGIASALQHDPALAVLDEPTNALDPSGVIRVREALLRRADAGAGLLISSHHLDEVARIAHRITVVNRGRIIGTLDPAGRDLERELFEALHADDVATGAAA